MFLIRKDLCYLCCRVVLLQVRCSYHPFLQPMRLCIPAKGLLNASRSLRWKCLTVDKTWGKCTKKYREKWIEVYLPAGASVYPFLCSSRVHGQLVTVSQPGVCRYGSRTDCCYGWKKNNKGHCEGNANSLCLFPLHSCVLGANKRTWCESARSYRRKAREGVKSLITWVGEWKKNMLERTSPLKSRALGK